ncbi:uncharacterized protein LOC121527596 [Cheilinus undulatus]|uniref:uncharacterized protein LOC121527596 n=1 Tax=Cheilinus undulatus TaxID=241271 RepID=UPI001BD50E3F|nr:uncharacterized protein LOC121527596 [Cheilinus undulatus]
MAKHNIGHLVAIMLALVFFIVAMVFTGLASAGKAPFLNPTGDVSDALVTLITPAGWTFSIWGIIYTFMALVLGYVISGIFRKNAYGYVYCSPPVLPHAFYLAWCSNLTFNITWLFLWDRLIMPVALVLLILVAVSNYCMILLSCYGLHSYGAWLNKYHKVDLWLHRVLIQNGIAIYATWTTIASHVNLTIVLIDSANMNQSDAATTALSILTVLLFVWFILENTVLDKHVRYILSIYPSVIWALAGVFDKNYMASYLSRTNIFIVSLLAIACFLFAARLVLVIWRHIKTPLYKEVDPDEMSPMEIADKRKGIFK